MMEIRDSILGQFVRISVHRRAEPVTFVLENEPALAHCVHCRNSMLEHLRPQYARRFSCLGSQCEDNCCRMWEVPIDRASYERYERNPELRPHLQDYFSLISDGATERRHALIRMNAASVCPFLSPERLCRLQQEYGESFLSESCATYPRNPRRLDGLLEQSLSLSCIEAARLVLLSPQLMPRAETGSSRYSRLLALPDQDIAPNQNQFRNFWDIREFCLLLVQDRTYPLWERLFILGMFCKRLVEIVGTRQFGRVPTLLHDYSEITSSGKLRTDMANIPVHSEAQVKMVVEVAFGYLRTHKAGLCDIDKCLQDFLHGVGYNVDESLESCTQLYVHAYGEYYDPFMERYPYLLENYLINHIFRVVFPFGQVPEDMFERPQREFLFMCVEFAVLKGLLIGAAGRYRELLSGEHVVKLVQSLAKTFEHDATLGGALNWQGLAEANCVAALLKN